MRVLKRFKEFIEKAKRGGWKIEDYHPLYITDSSVVGELKEFPLECMFLDPLAWKAVGKVEGWWTDIECNNINPDTYYKKQIHKMIHALCEGKSIETFLETL